MLRVVAEVVVLRQQQAALVVLVGLVEQVVID